MMRSLRLTLLFACCCGSPLFVGHAAAPQQLPFSELADGLYVFEGETADLLDSSYGMVANIAFVVGDSAVAVIDSGSSLRQGQMVRAAIREVTRLPIRYVISTHVHPDHVFGNAAFVADEPAFVAHRRFGGELAARGGFYLSRLTAPWYRGTALVEPTDSIAETRRIDLGNRVLTINVHERAHTSHDLSVYDASTDTLLAGDLVFVEHCPSLEGSVIGWIEALKQIEGQSYARIVPGHGPVQTDNRAIVKQRLYLERLARDVRAAIAAQVDLQAASSTLMLDTAQDWRLFDAFHTRNVIQAYTELEWE
jgi:quinoprotein relay system zinc metallohydrolase 2